MQLTCISLSDIYYKCGCEKSWDEVQEDSFSFMCRGCSKMKGLEVEIERLSQLVLALVGREDVGCASGSGGEQWMIKLGEAMREMLGRTHLSLGGG